MDVKLSEFIFFWNLFINVYKLIYKIIIEYLLIMISIKV